MPERDSNMPVKSPELEPPIGALESLEESCGAGTPERVLSDAGVMGRLSELKALAKSLFSCDPKVTVQTDHEIPDGHYLLLQVVVSGDPKSVVEIQEKWHAETSRLLGNAAYKVCLMISVA